MEIHVAKRSVYFRRTHVNYQSAQSFSIKISRIREICRRPSDHREEIRDFLN